MLGNVIDQIEGMTEDQQKELLGVQFPEDLVKQAEAEVDAMTLAEACYTLGGLKAERAVAEAEGIDKVASAEDVAAHDAQVKELGEDIDALVGSLGVASLEDPVALHKEAQAAAALIFQGYSDTLDKLAAGKLHEGVKKLMHHAKGGMHAAGHMAKKHKWHAAAGAGGVALGAYGMKHLQKKASELTGADLVEIMDARDAFADSVKEVEAGTEKLAGKAAEMGKALGSKLKEHGAKLKEMAGKHKGHAAAAGGGLLAGYAAGRAQK